MPLLPGTLIVGRFEIVAPIGAGSMGEVYQARDLKLHRDVALKLLSPALAASDEHLRRFEREARVASNLNHPHICTIYDVGQSPEADDRPYLVMELLRGTTLSDALAAGPLAMPTVISLGVQIAQALDAAHTAGVIHRDLKPANIFVTARGDAKLLDFGLAAMLATPEAATAGAGHVPPTALLTNPGATVGTVLYMSPEQAMGDPVDPRTDLFSLGLVLYEMLHGRRAFEGRSNTLIIDAILHDTPPGLQPTDVSTVPKDMRRLLMRLLEKDKARRPRAAAEVASYLRAIQSGSIAGREYAAVRESSSSSGTLAVGSDVFRMAPGYAPAASSGSGSLIAFSGSVRDAITVAVVLLVLAAAGYGVYSWTRVDTPPLASREPLLLTEFVNTTGEAVFDGALKDALEIQLQQSPFVNVLPGSQVRAALQRMERSPAEPVTPAVARDLCQRIGVKAIMLGTIAPLGSAFVITLEAQTCANGDTIAREQTQAAAKTDVLASVGAAAARIRERLGESLGSIQRFNVPAPDATTSSLDALKAYSMGVDTRVRTGEVQAIPLFERALELDPNFALAAARLGAIYTNLGDLEQAQKYMKQAFARSDSLSEPERLFIKSNYHFTVTGRLDEVVGTYRQWIDTYPSDWVPHNNLSSTYYRLNQFDDALEEARTAVRLGANSVVPYQQLLKVQLELDRLSDARSVLADARSKGLASSAIHALGFDIAFIDGDIAAMQEHLKAAASRPDRYLVLTEAARAAFAGGEFQAGQTLYAQAIAAARTANLNEFAASLFAEQALADALAGDTARSLGELQQALATSSGVQTRWTAALAAAFAGRAAHAAQLAKSYEDLAPPAPDVSAAMSPILRAAIALTTGDARRALTTLTAATPYARNTGPWLAYLRGLAHTSLREPQLAVMQFRDVIARRGNQPTNLLHALARLQLARALHAAGDTAAARQAYADFAKAWQRADPRHPLLDLSAREAASLKVAEAKGTTQ